MLTFADLYGERLSRELGSSDTVALFTPARRKAAINEAQTWFVTETGCLLRTAEIRVRSGVAEYDVAEEFDDADYLRLAEESPAFKAVASGATPVYLTGDDFPRRTVEWLDRYCPGWRSQTVTSGTYPSAWYHRVNEGTDWIGITPTPMIPSGATWTVQVPYVIRSADMVDDDDQPFTVSGTTRTALAAYTDALPLYAAAELEKLRKDTQQSAVKRQQAEQRVLAYLDKQRAPGGKTVGVARSYRREVAVHRG
jgi:hypothetical protein